MMKLVARQREVVFQTPCVMGIINLSANSFFDPSLDSTKALDKAAAMIQDGVNIIDVGAVATNPLINLSDIPSKEAECDRVIPFIEMLIKRFDIFISVDTSEPLVMQESYAAGAHMINDQTALRHETALQIMSILDIPVCLMHSFHPKRTPGSTTHLELLSMIKSDLQRSIDRCLAANISRDRIIVDPGFGGGYFGKNTDENFYLLTFLKEIASLSFPVLVGLSRKSMFGDLLQLPIEQRLTASVVGATIAAMHGASIVRVHDVKETIEAMKIVRKIKEIKKYDE